MNYDDIIENIMPFDIDQCRQCDGIMTMEDAENDIYREIENNFKMVFAKEKIDARQFAYVSVICYVDIDREKLKQYIEDD